MRIALVSRELHPVGGGGIGVAVAGIAAALTELGEVTILTRSGLEEDYNRLRSEGTCDWPDEVQVAFVPEPEPHDIGSYYNYMHHYSARVCERLRELYPDGGPDVVEFADYLGEGLVTVQARRSCGDFMRNGQVHVRTHTSAEMCGVLDGFIDDGLEVRALLAAERHVLREADRILWPGGDVHATYERFYGRGELAPASRVRGLIAPLPDPPPPAALPPAGEELRLLYIGRLERRKGVRELVRALQGVHADRWSLTLVGGDTDTAPLGRSTRELLELATAGNDRFRFAGAIPRAELAQRLADSHVVVCPSLWECWPSVVLEALAAGRPVLGTPTGGMAEMLAPRGAGWLTEDCGEEALARGVESLLERADEVDELIASGAPRRVYAELTDAGAFRAEYSEAVHAARPERRRSSWRTSQPLVSVVIPYFRLDRYVGETVRSVFEQEHERLEVIVVNDGSLRAEDLVLAELATNYPMRVLTQQNAGLGRARNAGIAQSRGAYVLPLDADNMLQPAFIRRCVELLEAEPRLAFATTWSQYVDEHGVPHEGAAAGYQPIGNYTPAALKDNVAGDAAAVIRKRIFDLGHWYSPDLTSYEDWQLYRELHRAGHYGRVIPERLLLYRVRESSMIRDVGLHQHDRLYREMNAHLREREVTWESRSASVLTP